MELPPGEVQHEAVHISDDDSATVITAVATCSFVAFTAVILRLISRRLKHLPLQQDDYAAIVALVRPWLAPRLFCDSSDLLSGFCSWSGSKRGSW